jgi:hypothetical protein
MDSKILISEDAGEKYEQKLKLMDASIKLLSIAGIIPSKEICSSLWKYRIYRLCQMSSYIMYIMVLILQVLGLHRYWGDIVITTDNMAVTGTFMIGYIPTIFAIINSTEICDLIDYLEKNSILSFRKIRSNTKHTKIIHEAKSLASHLTWFAIISLSITIFFWTVYPLVLLMFRSETTSTESHEDLRNTFQYFVFVMLIPSDVGNIYLYGIIYLFQAITFSMALIYLIGLIPLYLSLIVYTTAQFKIVSEAINEIDKAVPYQREKESMADFSDIRADREGKLNLFMRPRVVLSDDKYQRENTRKSRLVTVQNSALENGVEKQRHAALTEIESPEMSIYNSTNEVKADSTIFMIVECINLHQSAIR